jgi:hypothetical protein
MLLLYQQQHRSSSIYLSVMKLRCSYMVTVSPWKTGFGARLQVKINSHTKPTVRGVGMHNMARACMPSCAHSVGMGHLGINEVGVPAKGVHKTWLSSEVKNSYFYTNKNPNFSYYTYVAKYFNATENWSWEIYKKWPFQRPLKRQSHEIFNLCFFHQTSCPGPLVHIP